jgi:hypothetical protein
LQRVAVFQSSPSPEGGCYSNGYKFLRGIELHG